MVSGVRMRWGETGTKPASPPPLFYRLRPREVLTLARGHMASNRPRPELAKHISAITYAQEGVLIAL